MHFKDETFIVLSKVKKTTQISFMFDTTVIYLKYIHKVFLNSPNFYIVCILFELMFPFWYKFPQWYKFLEVIFLLVSTMFFLFRLSSFTLPIVLGIFGVFVGSFGEPDKRKFNWGPIWSVFNGFYINEVDSHFVYN